MYATVTSTVDETSSNFMEAITLPRPPFFMLRNLGVAFGSIRRISGVESTWNAPWPECLHRVQNWGVRSKTTDSYVPYFGIWQTCSNWQHWCPLCGARFIIRTILISFGNIWNSHVKTFESHLNTSEIHLENLNIICKYLKIIWPFLKLTWKRCSYNPHPRACNLPVLRRGTENLLRIWRTPTDLETDRTCWSNSFVMSRFWSQLTAILERPPEARHLLSNHTARLRNKFRMLPIFSFDNLKRKYY